MRHLAREQGEENEGGQRNLGDGVHVHDERGKPPSLHKMHIMVVEMGVLVRSNQQMRLRPVMKTVRGGGCGVTVRAR
jgi:hypothetical protein